VAPASSHESALKGLNRLADIVSAGIGPAGHLPVSGPMAFEDEWQYAAAQWTIDYANHTAKLTGDGTATTVILTRALYAEALKALAQGVDPEKLKAAIDKAGEAVSARLKSLAVPVKDSGEIAGIAVRAAESPAEIRDLVADALALAGDGKTHHSIIIGEPSDIGASHIQPIFSYEFDRGYLSPYFITSAVKDEAVLEQPHILLCSETITKTAQIAPVLEKAARSGKPLLIIADIEGEALATVVLSKLRGIPRVCAVKPPGFGSLRAKFLPDIATATGGKVLGSGVAAAALGDLGRATRVVVTRDYTQIFDGDTDLDDLQKRIDRIHASIGTATNASSDFDREDNLKRRAAISSFGGLIEIDPSGRLDPEQAARAVDDLINAARAVEEEGVVPGGGVALLRAASALDQVNADDDERAASAIVRKALEQPFLWIVRNAGIDAAEALKKVQSQAGPFGFDVITRSYGNLLEAGVADPTKAMQCALANAVGAAAGLITQNKALARNAERGRLVCGKEPSA
jgi:chaperonin GroEL